MIARLATVRVAQPGIAQQLQRPIGLARLLARPTASLTLEAQERRERLKKQFAD